jgi:hypothetical protein
VTGLKCAAKEIGESFLDLVAERRVAAPSPGVGPGSADLSTRKHLMAEAIFLHREAQGRKEVVGRQLGNDQGKTVGDRAPDPRGRWMDRMTRLVQICGGWKNDG